MCFDFQSLFKHVCRCSLILALPVVASAQNHDATLEIAAPAIGVSTFNLSATMPVPHGMVTSSMIDAGSSPFTIKNADGSSAQTQIEGISRASDGSWDVVQLLAKVKAQGNAPGSRDIYNVVRTPSSGVARPNGLQTLTQVISNGPVSQLPTSIKTLTQGTGKIIIRTFDVFGNEYRFDFGSKAGKIFKYGPSQSEVRVYGTMTPLTGGGNNALPHMMGAHGYFTAMAGEEVLQFWLRVSNSSTGLNPQTNEDDTEADMYFSKIELLLPSGYELRNAYTDPGWGTPYSQGGYKVFPIAQDLGSTMHVMPTLRHLIRHLAIIPSTPQAQLRANQILVEEELAFALNGTSTTNGQPLFSFFSPSYRGFLPQSAYAPDLTFANINNLRSYLTSDFQSFYSKYSSGQCTQNNGNCNVPFVNPFMGWAMIKGSPYGGMTGGTDIEPNGGMEIIGAASADGFRKSVLDFITSSVRQQFFVKNNGDAVNIEDLKQTGACGEYAPIEFFDAIKTNTYDPFGLNSTNQTHVNYVTSHNLIPWYATELAWTGAGHYAPHDFQHSIRAIKNNHILAWIGGLSIAMDQIQADAGNATFQHSRYPVKCIGSTPKVLATSLLKFDPAIPHITIKFGRGQAWWAYALLAAYTTTKDDSLRANLRPNFDIAIQALEKAIVPCSGVFNGVVNKDTNNLFVSAHNYEKAFAELVMGGVENKVYANTGLPEAAPLDSFLTTAAKTPLRRGYALVTKFWKSMRRLLIVADKNNPTNVYCAVSQMPAAARPFTNNKPDSGEAMLAFTLNAEKNPSKAHLYSKIADMKLGGISNAPDLLGKLEEYKNQHGKLIGQISAMTGQLLACVQNGLCPN